MSCGCSAQLDARLERIELMLSRLIAQEQPAQAEPLHLTEKQQLSERRRRQEAEARLAASEARAARREARKKELRH